MLDLSWGEMMVIGIVAIIFIGPKELPNALRTVGKWTAKARGMAREFQNSVDDMVRETELAEIKKQVQEFQSGDITRQIEKTIDPTGEISKAMTAPDLPASPMADVAPTPSIPQPLPEPPAAPPPPASVAAPEPTGAPRASVG